MAGVPHAQGPQAAADRVLYLCRTGRILHRGSGGRHSGQRCHQDDESPN